jgi:hypothetical protein
VYTSPQLIVDQLFPAPHGADQLLPASSHSADQLLSEFGSPGSELHLPSVLRLPAPSVSVPVLMTHHSTELGSAGFGIAPSVCCTVVLVPFCSGACLVPV